MKMPGLCSGIFKVLNFCLVNPFSKSPELLFNLQKAVINYS